MTTKSDVSLGNWAALVAAGPAIARAVSASAGSTDRSEAELEAYVQFVSDAATSASGDDVLGQLVTDVANLLAVGVEPVAGDAFSEGLEQARRAGAIIAVELEPGEATAVRGWYLAAASRVAEAAREGGIFGIGASDVSTWERETIQSIADALGTEASLDLDQGTASMGAVELRDIVTDADRAAALAVRSGPGQDTFVASVEQSFADAEQHPEARARYWTVHDGDAVVGFAMISDGIPEETLAADPTLVGPYFLWRLLIDERHQRRGYGTATLDAVVAYVRAQPGATELLTSYSEGEGNPRPFYERYGFVATDRVVEGERVLRLDLRP